MNNFIDEFRNTELTRKAAAKLSEYKGRPVKIMEVCGTHTMSIFKYGIRDMLPENVHLISGPGCPVCVTPVSFIDSAIELSVIENVIITTFGDLMRVPGSTSSLLSERAKGRDIRIVYSPLDAVMLAKNNPGKKIVFLSVGFETTTPVAALSVLKAKEMGLDNFMLLTANKTMPEVLKTLAASGDVEIDGYLYPGHVSSITGVGIYYELAEKSGISGVITGFEPLDILQGIATLINNIDQGKTLVSNAYKRAVRQEGNPIAVEKLYEVFEPYDSVWRGIGTVKDSGLKIRDKYSSFDAAKVFNLVNKNVQEPKGCLCGEILKGTKIPPSCSLFGKRCTPENPVGACMVSSEGTCAAYYKYGGTR